MSDLVFRPSSVEERGWVLILNTILATAATQSPQLTAFVYHLRWNVWLAADEASLFLEPSVLNIQALTIFACHGQDLVTPSLCWSLMSQACRMAQTMNLHRPSRSGARKNGADSLNLCLFWSLFIVDKTLSLAFGCPPVLPTSLYRLVALPSPQQLWAYRPHLSNTGSKTTFPSHVESFGPFYFVQCIKLAMIMGEVSDYFLSDVPGSRQHLELKRKLDEWISEIRQVGKCRQCSICH